MLDPLDGAGDTDPTGCGDGDVLGGEAPTLPTSGDGDLNTTPVGDPGEGDDEPAAADGVVADAAAVNAGRIYAIT